MRIALNSRRLGCVVLARVLALALVTATPGVAAKWPRQARAQAADPAPFSKALNEHTISVNQPFETREIRGLILRSQGEDRRVPHARVELRGDATKGRVRHVVSDDHGRFRFKHLRQGSYEFKVTLDGFQSVTGTILVSKKAPKKNRVNIEMPPAV